MEYAFDIAGIAAHIGTWFEHSGAAATAYYYNNFGRVYLDDPQAFEKWYTLIGSFITQNFHQNLIIYKGVFLGG